MTIQDKLNQGKEKLSSNAAMLRTATKDFAYKGSDFASHSLKKAGELAQETQDFALNRTLDSNKASKVSFWAGISSLVGGFPANVVAIVAGHIVEDRRRSAKNGAYKVSAKALIPTDNDVKRSRVGLLTGYGSLIVGFVVLTALVARKKHD